MAHDAAGLALYHDGQLHVPAPQSARRTIVKPAVATDCDPGFVKLLDMLQPGWMIHVQASVTLNQFLIFVP